jgi:adenylate kinase family enzyme
MHRVLGMWDYSLVIGMPGTGKTTTILHIIKVQHVTRISNGSMANCEQLRR